MTEIIPRSHDKRMPHEALMRLVEAGDWDARAIYAAKLIFGQEIDAAAGQTVEVQPDPDAGLALLREAHEAGSVRATAELAFRHTDPNGPAPRDFDAAESFAALAIERGNPYGWLARLFIAQAQGDLAAAYQAGKRFLQEVDPAERQPEVVYSVGWLAAAEGLYAEAAPFYEEAAMAGHAPAAINLALMISRGQCALPAERAIPLLRAAAEAGSPAGVTLFAHRALHPEVYGDAPDPALRAEAVGHLVELTEQETYHEPFHLLAQARAGGLGVERDEADATRLFGLAADCEDADIGGPSVLGPGRANIDYALRLAGGQGAAPDPEAALDRLERAAEIAARADRLDMVAAAADHAARVVEAADAPELAPRLTPLLAKGAQNGDPEVMTRYARALMESAGGVREARPWFVRALACEDPEAGLSAARLLLARDEKPEAYAFARAAADLGAELPPELAALDPEARTKGSLFRKGKTGRELHQELSRTIAETIQRFGPATEETTNQAAG